MVYPILLAVARAGEAAALDQELAALPLGQVGRRFLLRSGRCVSAEAAAVFAALLAFRLRSTRPAADAARLLVTSQFALRSIVCDSFHVGQVRACAARHIDRRSQIS
jgi:hypothetical protein